MFNISTIFSWISGTRLHQNFITDSIWQMTLYLGASQFQKQVKGCLISYSLENLNLSLQLEFPQAAPGSPNHQPDRRGYIQHHGVLHRLPDNLCHLHYVVTSHFVDEFIMELQSKRRTTGGPLLPPSTPLERFPVRPGQPQPFLHFNHGSLHQVSSRTLHLVTHKKWYYQ